MEVYVNWDEKKILTEAGKDRRIAEIANDFAHDTDTMYDFIRNTGEQLLTDIANGDDAAVEDFRNSYKEYVENEAAEYFFEDYEIFEAEG